MKKNVLVFFFCLPILVFGQFCDSFSLNDEDDLELGCTKNTLTVLHDQQGRPFLYAANAQGGLSVIDNSDPLDLSPTLNLAADHFENLNVNSLTQNGSYLYAALGDIFGSHDQPSGLAIINIENPAEAFVEDVWFSETNAGAAFVAVTHQHAYLCALKNGVIVLDIADKTNISFVSQYMPPTDWPAETDTEKIGARNLVIEGTTGYLCYDAGGIRLLDLSNPDELSEIGRFSNPAMDGAARAYNNCLKDGNLLYVAVDYAGMEVLDVSNPDAITLHGWWNPNEFPFASPALTSLRWFSSEWHTNEIALIKDCNLILMSAGRSEVVGVDIANPAVPMFCGTYGTPDDNASSWGLSVYGDHVYVGMICTFGVPFPGDWSGVKSLVYDSDCPLNITSTPQPEFKLYPNPTQGTLLFKSNGQPLEQLIIYTLSGQTVHSVHLPQNEVDLSFLTSGTYIVHLVSGENTYVEKIQID